jgi:hypothetical protein
MSQCSNAQIHFGPNEPSSSSPPPPSLEKCNLLHTSEKGEDNTQQNLASSQSTGHIHRKVSALEVVKYKYTGQGMIFCTTSRLKNTAKHEIKNTKQSSPQYLKVIRYGSEEYCLVSVGHTFFPS